jgi:hypothetical protein
MNTHHFCLFYLGKTPKLNNYSPSLSMQGRSISLCHIRYGNIRISIWHQTCPLRVLYFRGSDRRYGTSVGTCTGLWCPQVWHHKAERISLIIQYSDIWNQFFRYHRGSGSFSAIMSIPSESSKKLKFRLNKDKKLE